jgi:hypothetical protein
MANTPKVDPTRTMIVRLLIAPCTKFPQCCGKAFFPGRGTRAKIAEKSVKRGEIKSWEFLPANYFSRNYFFHSGGDEND